MDKTCGGRAFYHCRPCCYCYCCCPPCPPTPPTPPTPPLPPTAALRFHKVDGVLGLPLAGAQFTLSQNGAPVASTTSDAAGLVDFGDLSPGTYTLRESVPPPGYQPNHQVHTVVVNTNGSITVDGLPLNQFEVVNTPLASEGTIILNFIDENGAPLRPTEVLTVAAGAYGPYEPPDIPGYIFLQLAPGSAPLQGNIAAGQTVTITYVYQQGGLIQIRYSGGSNCNCEGCANVYPEQDITVPPGPYNIDVPQGNHANPNDDTQYYLLLALSPINGVIAAGQAVTIELLCVALSCPDGAHFDPIIGECSLDANAR